MKPRALLSGRTIRQALRSAVLGLALAGALGSSTGIAPARAQGPAAASAETRHLDQVPLEGHFSPDVIRASRHSGRFAEHLNHENLQLARAVFADLKACYDALSASPEAARKKQAEELARHFAGFQSLSYGLDDGRRFRMIDLLMGLEVEEHAPVELPGYLLLATENLPEGLRKACSEVSAPKVGSAHYDQLFGSILAQLRNPTRRKVLWTLVQGSRLTTRHFAERLIGWAPKEVTSRIPFMSEPWSKEFLSGVLKNPGIRSSMATLLWMDQKNLERLTGQAYETLKPYQIAYDGLEDNNQVFPFVSLHAQRFFAEDDEGRKIRRCMARATEPGAGIPLAAWTEGQPEQRFRRLAAELKRVCPETTPLERMAMLTINDRMSDWVLPLSMKKAIARARKLEGFDRDGSVFKRDAEAERELYFEYQGAREFTARMAIHLYPTAFNHVAAPAFLRCELERLNPEPRWWWQKRNRRNRIEAVVMLFGLGYQLFDAQAKIALKKIPVKDVTSQALSDMELWKKAFALDCAKL